MVFEEARSKTSPTVFFLIGNCLGTSNMDFFASPPACETTHGSMQRRDMVETIKPRTYGHPLPPKLVSKVSSTVEETWRPSSARVEDHVPVPLRDMDRVSDKERRGWRVFEPERSPQGCTEETKGDGDGTTHRKRSHEDC